MTATIPSGDHCLSQRLVAVAGERRGPRKNEVAHGLEVVVIDVIEQPREVLAVRHRLAVLARVERGHGRRPEQLGPRLGIEGVGVGQELADPGAAVSDRATSRTAPG
jgi:hypothetical protein